MNALIANDLDAARDGRASLRQLVSLARAKVLTNRDFFRLTDKIRRALEVLPSRDGPAVVRRLQAMAVNDCLTDPDFDAATKRLGREFETFMGRDTEAAAAPTFYVVGGGRP